MSTTGVVVVGWTVMCAVNIKQLFQCLHDTVDTKKLEKYVYVCERLSS